MTAQSVAARRIDELFREDISSARAPESKGALAEKYFEQASTTEDDPEGRYVLFDRAYQLGIEIGQAELAVRSAATLSELYDVDGLGLQVKALDQIRRRARTLSSPREIADTALDLTDQAVLLNRYEEADSLAAVALAVATKIRDTELRNSVRARRDEIAQRKQLWKAAEEARITLQTSPDDFAAHAALGKYLCFVADDWKSGLSHLAKSGDDELAKAAELERDPPKEAAQQAAAGDAWWALSRSAREPDRSAFQSRAAHWYRLATEGLTGLARLTIEQRLKEIDSASLAKSSGNAKNLAKGAKVFPGMIGRARNDGFDIGTIFLYRQNSWFRHDDFTPILTKKGRLPGKVEVQLIGLLQVPAAGDIAIRHAGGSAAGGVCRLYINGKELGAVGDDRTKDTIYNVTLPKGVYQLKWVLTGGQLGSCLIHAENSSQEVLPIVYTPAMLKLLRALPTSSEIEMAAEKKD